MRQRAARLLPFTWRSGDADPETAPGGAERRGAGADAAVGRPRPHHRLRRQPAAARLRQRDPDQPDLESRLHPDPAQPGLAPLSSPRAGAVIASEAKQSRDQQDWIASSQELLAMTAALTDHTKNSFRPH